MEIRVSGHQSGNRLGPPGTRRRAPWRNKRQVLQPRAVLHRVRFGKAPASALRLRHRAPRQPGADPQEPRPGATTRTLRSTRRPTRSRSSFARYKRRLQGPARAGATTRMPRRRSRLPCSPPKNPKPKSLSDAPPVIAETRTDIPEVSVSDAVMLLDFGTPPRCSSKMLEPDGIIWFTAATMARSDGSSRPERGSVGLKGTAGWNVIIPRGRERRRRWVWPSCRQSRTRNTT